MTTGEKIFILVVEYDADFGRMGENSEVFSVSTDRTALVYRMKKLESDHAAAAREWDDWDNGRKADWGADHDRKFEELQKKYELFGLCFGMGIKIYCDIREPRDRLNYEGVFAYRKTKAAPVCDELHEINPNFDAKGFFETVKMAMRK